ncbi:MAG: TRAP transporter small permease subunit, partial [Granulosicoccus sp.]|nr:TRAP transporter small permease subunit [Granulosicoccus sp.]
ILITLGLMLAINIDVAGRTLFGSPIDGIPELVTLCVVSIVFLQISQACRSGRLTRSNVVLDWIRTRCVNCVACLEVLFDLVAAGMVSIILIVSVPLFLKSIATESFIGSIGVFTVPLWPVKGIILIGCAMLTLQLLLSSLRQIFRLWHQRHQRLHGTEHDAD